MKICYSTLGCPDWNIKQIIDNAVKFDMDGVELRGRHHVSPELPRNEKENIKEMFERSNLEIACISAYTRFSMENAQERHHNEKELMAYVRLAQDMGCRYVRTFIGKFPDLPQEQVYDYVAQSLNRVAKAIDDTEVQVLIETHDFLCTAAMLEPLLRRMEHQNIAVLWDMAHSYRAGEALQTTFDIMGKTIRHVHLKDEYREENGQIIHCIPGEGIMPIQACVEILNTNGYKSYYSLEWERTWHPEMPPLEEALPVFSKIMREFEKKGK